MNKYKFHIFLFAIIAFYFNQHVEGKDLVQTVSVGEPHYDVYFDNYTEKVAYCLVHQINIKNEEENFLIRPFEHSMNQADFQRKYDNSCSFQIGEVKDQHIGQWTVTGMSVQNKIISQDTLTLYKYEVTAPLGAVPGYFGGYVTVFVDRQLHILAPKPNKNCNSTCTIKNKKLNLNHKINASTQNAMIKGIGGEDCFVDILVSPETISNGSDDNHWELEELCGFVKTASRFTIKRNIDPKYWIVNSTQTLQLESQKKIESCAIGLKGTPEANLTSLEAPACKFSVQQATHNNTGTYVVKLKYADNTSTIEERFNVTVVDKEFKILYAKRGDTFRIVFESQSELALYRCFAKSQQGKVYEGMGGLNLQSCTIVIKNAGSEHNGYWHFYENSMSENNKIKPVLFQVVYRESFMKAEFNQLPGTSEGTIKCSVLDEIPLEMAQCRWVTPAEWDFPNENSTGFTLFETRRNCSIKLHNIRYAYGKWRCEVKFPSTDKYECLGLDEGWPYLREDTEDRAYFRVPMTPEAIKDFEKPSEEEPTTESDPALLFTPHPATYGKWE